MRIASSRFASSPGQSATHLLFDASLASVSVYPAPRALLFRIKKFREVFRVADRRVKYGFTGFALFSVTRLRGNEIF